MTRVDELWSRVARARAGDDADEAEIALYARWVILRHGSGALLPYQLGPDASAYGLPGVDGAVSYARSGRTAVALGDPIGPGDAAWRTFDSWLATCRRHGWLPGVYQASREVADRLLAARWQAYLVGLEAVVDPGAFQLRTPRLANVRHTVTRAKKGGVTVAWSATGPDGFEDAGDVLAKMEALDAAWRADAGPQMGFTVGRFDQADLDSCGIAVARSGDGSLEAFVVLRHTGADDGWMLDLMRRRRNGVPGAVEACLVTAIEGLKAIGVTRLSLGLAPLYGLEPDRGPIPERALAVGARMIRRWYDYPGLAFYKNKFNPTWERRYLVVRHRRNLLPVGLALLRLHLGGSLIRGMLGRGGS